MFASGPKLYPYERSSEPKRFQKLLRAVAHRKNGQEASLGCLEPVEKISRLFQKTNFFDFFQKMLPIFKKNATNFQSIEKKAKHKILN